MDSAIHKLLGSAASDPGCDGAFEVLDQYAEARRAGADADAMFPDFATHLRHCTACREDTEALLAALEAMDQSRE